MKQRFPYIVKPVDQETYGVNYIVEYLDFPGITGGGETHEVAIQMADEALDMYLETLEREGKALPSPTSLDATGRVTLRLPKSMHLSVIEMSEREGVSLNAYIVDALSYKLSTTSFFDEMVHKLSKDGLTRFKDIVLTETHSKKQVVLSYTMDFMMHKAPLNRKAPLNMGKRSNDKEEDGYAFSG